MIPWRGPWSAYLSITQSVSAGVLAQVSGVQAEGEAGLSGHSTGRAQGPELSVSFFPCHIRQTCCSVAALIDEAV